MYLERREIRQSCPLDGDYSTMYLERRAIRQSCPLDGDYTMYLERRAIRQSCPLDGTTMYLAGMAIRQSCPLDGGSSRRPDQQLSGRRLRCKKTDDSCAYEEETSLRYVELEKRTPARF